MALIDTFKTAPALTLSAPFRAIGRFLIMVAESNSLAREIEKLNAMSDEELASRGVTREEAAQTLLRDRFYM